MDAHKTIQTIFHVLAILVILGFLGLQAGGCMILVSAMGDGGGGAQRAAQGRDEVAFGDENAEATFLRLPVAGVIRSQGEETVFGIPEMSALERAERLIEHARETKGIDGILVDIDSPGGAIDPSDIIYRRLRRYAADTGKPVVANLNGVAASGGYYVAAAADRIVAHPSCITGSIGVIIQSFNFAGLFEKVGVELVTLTSGPNKDLLNPGRPLKEEEREILMGVVEDAYDSFVGAVAAGREMDEARVRELGDGRIYTAGQAAANGLIDRVGYEEELLEELRAAAGVERVRVVDHRLPLKLWDMLDLGVTALARRLQVVPALPGAERLALEPGLYYLWTPKF